MTTRGLNEAVRPTAEGAPQSRHVRSGRRTSRPCSCVQLAIPPVLQQGKLDSSRTKRNQTKQNRTKQERQNHLPSEELVEQRRHLPHEGLRGHNKQDLPVCTRRHRHIPKHRRVWAPRMERTGGRGELVHRRFRQFTRSLLEKSILDLLGRQGGGLFCVARKTTETRCFRGPPTKK